MKNSFTSALVNLPPSEPVTKAEGFRDFHTNISKNAKVCY